ncbi:hypothetical protein EDB89DRAFT_1912666 [Lactarius sanguifluus]|nr:hypothetical protein EDB89DRAFT_1912666 [Lactarius sanguifluus]
MSRVATAPIIATSSIPVVPSTSHAIIDATTEAAAPRRSQPCHWSPPPSGPIHGCVRTNPKRQHCDNWEDDNYDNGDDNSYSKTDSGEHDGRGDGDDGDDDDDDSLLQ